MPKPRTKLSAVEEAIISKGGEPGSSARVEPIRKDPVKAAPPPEEPDDDDGKQPTVYRHTMVRFTPKDFNAIKKAIERQSEELAMKVSLNAWVVSACREKLKRESE